MVNEWIIGKQELESAEHRKRVLLAGYFIMTYLTTGAIWIILSFFDDVTDYTVTKIGFIINLFCLFLVRKGWFYTGTFLFFVRAFAVTVYYCWLYPGTNSDLFFVLIGPAAIAIYGYEKRWIGLSWAIVGCMLYLMVSIRAPEFIIGSDYFNRIVSFILTYAAIALLVVFFSYLTYQYDQRLTKQNAELIKANQELDHFVHTASHDLKAPLNSVLGLLGLIKMTENKEEINAMYDGIDERIGSMKLFINDVAEHARSTRTEIQREPIALKILASEIHSNFGFDEKASRVAFINDISDDLVCLSDRYRLRLILSNIIYNGIKYSDPAKAEPFVRVIASKNQQTTRISIFDNGIGIERENVPKLFKMFYRATSISAGTGIGLYIVKEAVDKLSGKIDVDSEIGQGTSFVITFPS
jgi:signal transduction histidine kinase